MNVSRTEALNLSTTAYDLGADVLRGLLQRATDGAPWTLGETNLDEWLERYEGQELIVIVASVGPRSIERQICRTCGAEYTGSQCPHCREVRQRLRGRK